MKRLYKALIVLISIILLSQLAISDMQIIEVNEGDLVSLKLKAIDEDGDPLTYTFTEPLNESGQWQTTYGDYGEYEITVTVSDNKTETSKKLLLKVNKVNWPPVLEDLEDIIITETEKAVIEPKAFDEERDSITYTISDPIGNDGVWQTGYDDAGEYEITVTASDQTHIATKTFTLIVEDLNRDPLIESSTPEESSIEIDEGEEIKFSVSATEPDKDPLTYSWQLDDAQISTDSSYTYHADYDSAGTHQIKVDLSDGQSILRRTWDIIVNNVNRPPILEPIQDIVINENQTFILDFSASDPDGDDIMYRITDPIGSDKEWTPTFDDVGEYEIEVTISDGELTDSQIVKLTVLDVDRAPLFKKIDDITITEEEIAVINLKAEDPDEDRVTFSALSLPNGASLVGNKFKFTPTYETVQKPGNWFNKLLNKLHLEKYYYKDYKEFIITLVASGKEQSTTQAIKMTVQNINRAPILLDLDDIIVSETDVVRINPRAIDYDNDRIRFTISAPVGDDCVWETTYDDNGEYTITITALDGYLTDTKDITVFVENVNREPVFAPIDRIKVNENEPVLIRPVITDPDGDTVELSVDNPPSGSTFIDNKFKWTPGFDATIRDVDKNVVITFTGSDDKAIVKQSVLVTVKDVNRPPVLLNATPEKTVTAYLNEPVYFTAASYDYDNDTLSYTWKFGTFDRIKGPPALKRTFTTKGNKVIKLLISDGEDSITKGWLVNVIGPRPVPKPKTISKKIKYTIDNSKIESAETSFTID